MMLSQPTLDRNSEIPLFRQLRAAIEMAIINGELADGTAMPSVRRLASLQQVSPVTVVQAYKSLQAQGLLRSVPKRGYFVSLNSRSHHPSDGLLRIQHLVDQALDAAAEAEIDTAEVARIVMERARLRNHGQRTVAVFGYKEASLDERVSATQAYLSDMNVNVVGISFEESASLDAAERDLRFRQVDVFLVSVGEMEKAAALLDDHSERVLPMTRVLRGDVVRFMESQPPDTRFGIIAQSPEYAERMIAGLRRTKPLAPTPLVAIVTDSTQVQRVIDEVEVILIGSIASSALGQVLPYHKRAINFISLPDKATLTRLREELVRLGPHDE